MATTWRPTGADVHYGRRRPEVGEVVGWDHRAWTVEHVQDAMPTDEETDTLQGYREPWRTEKQPYRMSLRLLHGEPTEHAHQRDPGLVGLRFSVRTPHLPVYPDGRVPLCSCHQHPWPCREALEQAEAEAAAAKMDRQLRLVPGACPACEEPVTHRQRSITFAGPNVSNPLADGPTYHLRRKCRQSAAAYENLWVRADPTRPRSLLTLSCEGTVVVHGDGTAECHGAVDSDCPSIYAQHRGATACYYQTHGCPRECGRHGYGCHPAGYPADPRDLAGRTA